jgi:hypothetical protein
MVLRGGRSQTGGRKTTTGDSRRRGAAPTPRPWPWVLPLGASFLGLLLMRGNEAAAGEVAEGLRAWARTRRSTVRRSMAPGSRRRATGSPCPVPQPLPGLVPHPPLASRAGSIPWRRCCHARPRTGAAGRDCLARGGQCRRDRAAAAAGHRRRGARLRQRGAVRVSRFRRRGWFSGREHRRYRQPA